MKKPLVIRLREEIEDRLEKLAVATNRTKTFYAREAIAEHIENLEKLYFDELTRLDEKRNNLEKDWP